MMSKEKRRVPKLRFPGFTEDWEQRKLGDIATITGGGTPSTNISEYWNGDIDWYSPLEIGENRYVSRSTRKITKLGLEKSSAKILSVGTVLFTSRAGIGNTAILQAEGCTNQGFQSITPNSKELDTYFLYTMTPKLKRYGEVTGAGSTFVEVSGKQMEQMNLMIPSLEEQKHVSQLFELMDDAITLHQRKLDNLKLKKKALLQKLFPKNGERYPELRFPGFTDAWEQRKADYIFKSVTDKGYPELPVLSASQELGMVYRDQNGIDIQHDKKNETSYKRVLPGQFVIHLRSFQGGFAYSEIEGITSPAYTVMSFKNSSEQYGLFWKHVFKSETFIKRLETITYGIRDGRSISFSDFKSLLLQYPSFSEQKLIGDSIAVIERGITLHQRKLDHLQLQKKALLQQMFV